MKEANEFFEKLTDAILTGINTAALARVESYDANAATADITVLPDGDFVQNVPVATLQGGGFYIRAPLAKGETVVVVFSKQEIEGIMRGEAAGSTRTFDVNDGMVLGGVNLFSEPLPAGDADKLVVGRRSGPGKITIATDGVVTIQGRDRTESW